jgi:hypothetical protein
MLIREAISTQSEYREESDGINDVQGGREALPRRLERASLKEPFLVDR